MPTNRDDLSVYPAASDQEISITIVLITPCFAVRRSSDAMADQTDFLEILIPLIFLPRGDQPGRRYAVRAPGESGRTVFGVEVICHHDQPLQFLPPVDEIPATNCRNRPILHGLLQSGFCQWEILPIAQVIPLTTDA